MAIQQISPSDISLLLINVSDVAHFGQSVRLNTKEHTNV